jgi:tripartite-type tricarboxylate transporter receptor subunit TctC
LTALAPEPKIRRPVDADLEAALGNAILIVEREEVMKNLIILLSLIGISFGPTPARAQDKYPSSPIKFVLAYGPGTATDIITRVMCEDLRQILGQTCVVDNKPGAFGILAIEEMARSKPNGYTLQVGNVSTNAITPVLFADKMKINYVQDVVAIGRLADISNMLLATTKDFPPRTVAEAVAYAKKNPGKLNYATPGAGSFPHFDMEVLNRRAGIDMKAIHFKAGPTAYVADMAKGDVQLALMNVATAGPLIKSGTVRPLALVADERLSAYPDVPTLTEAGYPGVGTTLWAGLFAPAATPPDILQTLQRAVTQALNSPRVIETYSKQNIRSRPTSSLAEAKAWFQSEMTHWQKIINEVKIDLTD